jgi:uracil-DNA glycosylase
MSATNQLLEPLSAVLDRAPEGWRPIIEGWRLTAAGQRLIKFVEARQQAGAVVYPAAVLRALELTPREAVRVVILGQDPYHGAGQAEGLAFSVPAGVRPPPSLRNMMIELACAPAAARPQNGHLGSWARQGVLLLNTCLTVEEGLPASHARQGWEALTDRLIEATARDAGAKVYLLWGGHAQAKAPLIEAAGGGRHLVLTANHPSPLSARRPPLPFIGCGHFAAANDFLGKGQDAAEIDWSL